MNSFFMLSRALNDVRRDASASMLEESWFTKLMNEHSSVQFVETGYFTMASVIAGSIC